VSRFYEKFLKIIDIVYAGSVVLVVIFVAVTVYGNYKIKEHRKNNPQTEMTATPNNSQSHTNIVNPRYEVIQDLISKSIIVFNMGNGEAFLDDFVWRSMDKQERRVLMSLIVMYIMEDDVEHSKNPIIIYNMQSGERIAQWESNIIFIDADKEQ
jgi:hypothetical protein